MTEDLARRVLDPDTLIAVMTFLAALATALTLLWPFLSRDRLAPRLKAVASRREELRAKSRKAMADKARQGRIGPRKADAAPLIKQIVDALNIRKLTEAPGMKEQLAQAGFRGQGPVITYMFFRFVLPFAFLGGALVYLMVFSTDDTSPFRFALVCFLAFACGYYLPSAIVQNLAVRRRQALEQAFPDALDLLLICVEAGMSIEAAFNRVAGEIGRQSVELAEELALTTAELSYLPERRIAYENLAGRTGLPGIRAVCTSLIQAERYGTPLGKALRVMAAENRTIRMQTAEKKAASLPAKLTVPMIVFFLPALFVVIIGPAVLQFMD